MTRPSGTLETPRERKDLKQNSNGKPNNSATNSSPSNPRLHNEWLRPREFQGSSLEAESYAGFQPPPPQTQRADFPHWAFLCVSHQGLCGRFMLIGFHLLARTTR